MPDSEDSACHIFPANKQRQKQQALAVQFAGVSNVCRPHAGCLPAVHFVNNLRISLPVFSMRPVRTTSSATSTFFGILPSFSFSLRLSILQSQSGISFGSAFFLPVPMPALLLHFHAKNFIKGCPIPSERPRQSGQRHSQQKNQRIHSSRHMQVIPKPLPAFRARYLQTIFNALRVRGHQTMIPEIKTTTNIKVLTPTIIFPQKIPSPPGFILSSNQRCIRNINAKKPLR